MTEEKESLELKLQLASKERQCSFGAVLIKENDVKTRFYTGLPVYGVFDALADYLSPKAVTVT